MVIYARMDVHRNHTGRRASSRPSVVFYRRVPSTVRVNLSATENSGDSGLLSGTDSICLALHEVVSFSALLLVVSGAAGGGFEDADSDSCAYPGCLLRLVPPEAPWFLSSASKLSGEAKPREEE